MNETLDNGAVPDAGQDDDFVRLLRQAGMRTGPPPDREARVRTVVLAECRAVARDRAIRRRAMIGVALLASAAAAVIIVRLARPVQVPAPAGVVAATIERLAGEGRHVDGHVVFVGAAIETSASGRLGLRLADGVSMRLDRGSRVTFRSPTEVELGQGAIYVDNTQEAYRLAIHTPFGTVRDIGTQFEVRLSGDLLRVRVRSGLVEVGRGSEIVTAHPATEVTLGSAGLSNRPVAPHGPDWDWIVDLATPLTIEGRPLDTVLAQLCREHGWTLRYEDAALARRASAVILRGSVEGLKPQEALGVVIETSGLAYRLTGGELLVLRSQGR